MRMLRWLYPGLRVKRWLLLFTLGLALLTLGGALLLNIAALPAVEEGLRQFLFLVTGERTASTWVAAAVLLGLGVFTTAVAVRQLVRGLIRGITGQPVAESGIAERLYVRWHLSRGPRVVAIGGGTGLPVVLRGLKEYTGNITAIVTVADDGGSSGRLRGELGIPPPGDIRNCLVALADTEPLMERLLQYRFEQGSLSGHAVGNIFIGAMNELSGDFVEGIRQLSRVLAVRGQVLPSSVELVSLRAQLGDGTWLEGESDIGQAPSAIRRIELVPRDASPPPEAVRALRQADVIVVGPGSLYTSILPNLVVRELQQALVLSQALKVYVCNVMTQPRETLGYTAADHLRAIEQHLGRQVMDYIIVNSEPVDGELLQRYREEGAGPVQVDRAALRRLGVQPVMVSVIEQEGFVRHDPARLGGTIMELALRSDSTLRRLSLFDIHLLQERHLALQSQREEPR